MENVHNQPTHRYRHVYLFIGQSGFVSERGYLGKALRGADKALRAGVETADGVIDTAVDVGTGTVNKAVETGKDIGGQARRMVAGKTEIEMLERLGNMWREGMLTDEEFRAVKTRILDKI